MLFDGGKVGMVQPLDELSGILFNLLPRRTSEPVTGNQQGYRQTDIDADKHDDRNEVVAHEVTDFTERLNSATPGLHVQPGSRGIEAWARPA